MTDPQPVLNVVVPLLVGVPAIVFSIWVIHRIITRWRRSNTKRKGE